MAWKICYAVPVVERAFASLVLIAFACLFGARAHAQPRPRTLLRVLATSGVEGRFGTPVCDSGRDLVPHPSALFSYALSRQSEAADRPLIVDTGGLFEPSGVARFAQEHNPEALAELAHALGYRVLSLGERDLAAERTLIVSVFAALNRRGIPVVASNLRCASDARLLCDAVIDERDGPISIEAGNQTVSVLGFLDPSVLSRVSPDRAQGVSLAPIAEALPRAVRLARLQNEIVIAVLPLGTDEAIALTEEMDERDRPDLVILASSQSRLLFARPVSVVPPIVAAPPNETVEVIIQEPSFERPGVLGTLAHPLGQRGITVGEPVLDFLDDIGPAYCATWGRPLLGGRLARAIDPQGVATLVADLMRESVNADVAVLNHAIVDESFQPAHEHELTASDLYVALEHDEPLYEAYVPREWLVQLANQRDDSALLTPGLTGRDGDTRVRGRPLVSRAGYRVVTVRFLARTGQLPALPRGVRWQLLSVHSLHDPLALERSEEAEPEDGILLRELAIAALSRRDTRDPRDVRAAPGNTPEWLVQGTVDGTFSGSSITNPGRYDVASLNRTSTVALGLEVNLHADATAPDWTWENLGVLRYRTQWTQGATTSTGTTSGTFSEAIDQIQMRSAGSYRGFRASNSEWFVPDPYLEVFIESELTEPSTRDWHWFLFRPTLGARFPLTTDLELKLQTGLEAQLLQPGNEADWGLGAVLTLRPWDLLRDGDRRMQLQGLVDFFFADPGDANRVQVRGSLDASLDLAGPLALTFGARVYVQQERGGEMGFALDATAGFRIGTLTRAVGP